MILKNWLKEPNYLTILVIIGFIFLIFYAWLFTGVLPKFSSPDETANYYFIKSFAENNQLRFFEPLNQLVNGLIKPRSTDFVNGYTVPSSFLGMILIYGFIIKLFTVKILLFLTPLLSVVAVSFFYLLLKEIFERKTAFVAALFLFFLPPYWLYSARGLFHNIPFLAFLIIGLYCLMRALREIIDRKKTSFFIFSGLLISFSLITRTSEIFWVSLVLLILLFINRSKFKVRHFIFFILPIICLFILILCLDNHLYGSPLSLSYNLGNSPDQSVAVQKQQYLPKFINVFWPFGYDGEIIGRSVYQYLIVIFPWFSILLILGLLWSIKNLVYSRLTRFFPNLAGYQILVKNRPKIYLGLYLLMTVWLIFYYGSYELNEYFDQTKIILGSSYIRYWLPIYVFGLPFVVEIIMRIGKFFKKDWLNKTVVFFLIVTFCLFSVNKIMNDPLHGLWQVKKNNIASANLNNKIIEITEPDSVIISGHADKVFFPERKVIVSLPEGTEKQAEIIDKLLARVPVYVYYNPLDEETSDIFGSLQDYGFKLTKLFQPINTNEILYSCQKAEN